MLRLGEGQFTYDVTGDQWGNLPDGWLYEEVACVAVDSNDNLFAFNRGKHPMIVLDKNGNFLRSWGEDVFFAAHGISITPDGMLFCVDARDHTIRKFTPEGKLLMTFGEKGKHKQQLSGEPFAAGPTHAVVDPRDGSIYISDGYSNARVHKYTPDGKLLFSWGEPGTRPGQFCTVHKLAVDRDGNVYVADRENQRVQIFDSKGKYQDQWVNLAPPTHVHIDDRGKSTVVYVLETFGGLRSNYMDLGNWTGKNLGPRISIFDTSGNLLASVGDQPEGLGVGQFSMPHGMCVDSRGDIYFAEVPWGQFGSKMDPQRRDLRALQKLVRVDAATD